MSVIEVLLSVPDTISEGLADGTLERIGGVVRDATSKKTIAWLRDTGIELPREGTRLPAPSQQVLDALGLPIQAIASLQIANLAVSAAGFAMVLHKLGVIDRKLDAVLDRLASIGDDVQWVRDILDVDLLARLHAAARKLSLPVFDHPAIRQAILQDLIDIGETLDARRTMLLSQERALEKSDVFGIYSQYLGHCIQLQLSTCWNLNASSSGISLGNDWSSRLAHSLDRLTQPVRSGTANVATLRTFATLAESHRESAARAHNVLRDATVAVDLQIEQLEFLVLNGVRPDELSVVDAAHPEQLIMLQLRPDVPPN